MVSASVTGIANSTTPDSRQPKKERYQKGHGQRGQQQMLKQFVGLGLRRLTVIPRGGHGDVVGYG